jgi:hypothetical protein
LIPSGSTALSADVKLTWGIEVGSRGRLATIMTLFLGGVLVVTIRKYEYVRMGKRASNYSGTEVA